MTLNEAQKIAEEVKRWLKPYCMPGRCVIVGSIRRQKAECGDVELLCVPKFSVDMFGAVQDDKLYIGIQRMILGKHWFQDTPLGYRFNSKGSKVYGKKNKLLVHVASGFPVDIFSTTEENWAMSMVIRTGPKSSNIRLAMAAKKKGWRLNAYGAGYTREDGSILACKTEREVFELVGLEYKEPWER